MEDYLVPVDYHNYNAICHLCYKGDTEKQLFKFNWVYIHKECLLKVYRIYMGKDYIAYPDNLDLLNELKKN